MLTSIVIRAVTFVTFSSYLVKNSSKENWIKSGVDKIDELLYNGIIYYPYKIFPFRFENASVCRHFSRMKAAATNVLSTQWQLSDV